MGKPYGSKDRYDGTTHTRYDGTTDADPAIAAHLAELEQLAATTMELFNKLNAALVAAHQSTK